jgi:hypothetical protein
MSNKLNVEELAAKRYPNPTAMIPQPDGTFLNINHSATAYAAAIREVAQPIADERDELREVLKDASKLLWKQGMRPIPTTKGNMDMAMSYANEQGLLLKSIDAILAKYPKP